MKSKEWIVYNAELKLPNDEYFEINFPIKVSEEEVRAELRSIYKVKKLQHGLKTVPKIKKSQTSKPKPTTKVFTYENIETAKKQLKSGLKFPHVHIQHSMLGGEERVSILITISKDPKSEWPNKILQNSRYAQIHIDSDGKTEQFSGWRLKMRKFKGKDITHIVTKINAIKEK